MSSPRKNPSREVRNLRGRRAGETERRNIRTRQATHRVYIARSTARMEHPASVASTPSTRFPIMLTLVAKKSKKSKKSTEGRGMAQTISSTFSPSLQVPPL